MYRYAMVDPITNRVKNVVIWDGVKEWAPARKNIMIRSETANIDDIYDRNTNKFNKPIIQGNDQ